MNPKHTARRGSWRECVRSGRAARRWGFRFTAIVLGLSPLLVVEASLRYFNLPVPKSRVQTLAEATASRRLFVLNAERDRYEIATEHLNLFSPTSFPAEKPTNTKRIFVLGGSTVQGRPYAIQTAFSTWLELLLNVADDSFGWEVVNCGGVSYASYRVAALLPEVIEYEPDLIVVYTGHNEYLERVSVGELQSLNRLQATLLSLAERLHVYQLARQSILGTPEPIDSNTKRLVGETVQALLDHQGGLEHYHRDVPSRPRTEADFVANLESIIDYCRKQDVPLVLCCPARNVIDCPPFKSEVAADLEVAERLIFEGWMKASIDPEQSIPDRIEALRRAQQMDPLNPSVAYRLGRLLLEIGDRDAATTQLTLAVDADSCPLRIRSSMQQAIRELADRHDVPLVDIDQQMCGVSPLGIVGDHLMVDHVHPTIAGHQMIASSLAVLLNDEGIVHLRARWRRLLPEVYAKHLATLDETYYARGKQRLAGLRLWAAGRAGSLP
ncbi:MAG: SGNH/GDSL hydrolase family protein [Pirellulaceae bacterium]